MFLLVAAIAFAAVCNAQQATDTLTAPRKTATFYALDSAAVPEAVKSTPRALPEKGLVLRQQDDALWIGTANGLVRTDKAGSVQWLSGRRYLPDNDVRNIVPDGADGVWVRTATGIAHVDYTPITLAEKAVELERIQGLRHFRYGLVGDAVLANPGDGTKSRTAPSDNDGLWTAMYAAGECFRYSAEHSPEALARAQASLDAVLFLTTVSGIPGYPARSFVHAGEPLDGDVDRWYDAPDKRYRWKGDTSSDEIVGHYFLYATAYDLLPDAERRQRIATAVRAITDHILQHGYYLVGEKGTPTTWGRWSPAYLSSPGGKPAAPLNALELLCLLKVTAHITHDARYEAEYKKVAYEMGYAELGARYLELRGEEVNYSDEELFMLTIYPLMEYEKDPALLGFYQRALEQWWQNERREENPLWGAIYARITRGDKPELRASFQRLAEYPLNRVEWTVTNSQRGDVPMDGGIDSERCRQTTVLLPLDELPLRKWNSNPFCVDGGDGGETEAEATAFLLPYWMARYFRFPEAR
jgi:hypothetical protein